MDALVEGLKQIGLNSYEAKVYLALLKHHPATGYEISKDSGVPQARAYDTLKALESQNMVVSTAGKPVNYMPVPPEEILSRFESKYQGSIKFLRDTLPNFAVESIEPVHNLMGKDAIFQHAQTLIESAQETVFMELWSDDQHILEESLKAAVDRGVSVHIVGYNNVTLDFCNVHPHPLDDNVEISLGNQWLILAVDDAAGIVGGSAQQGAEPHAVWTKNPAIVFVIKELVVHDIFLLDVEKTMKDQMEAVYGSHRPKLRNKILGNEILIGAH